MSILERDPLNHNKLTLLTPSKALDTAIYYHTMGFTGERAEQLKVEKLQEVLGALLNTLNTKLGNVPNSTMLSDHEVVGILASPLIVYGVPQDDS